jgi:hypothetical protein
MYKKILFVGALFFIGEGIKSKPYGSWHPEETSYLRVLTKKLENNENIIFTKYGDGEYNCMIGRSGHNSDNDFYHPWLAHALKRSLIGLAKKPNTYIGRWPDVVVPRYCDGIVKKHSRSLEIPWVSYHLILNHDVFLKHDYMYNFVKLIIHSKKKKILICNHKNARIKDFFRADVFIEIPSTNWSYEYNKWKNIVEKNVENGCIVLISGGMCSKVLINDITDKYNLTFIDLGSGFDLLARKVDSRGWKHTYEDEIKYYKDLLPLNWD